MKSLKSWWETFIYNYRWSDYITYIDGWIPKLALSVPILGYLILFNDTISGVLAFNKIANESASLHFGLSGIERLRLLYFGLISLGVSNLIYKFTKPYQLKFGTNLVDYTKTCLELFTFADYAHIHGTIKSKGHSTLKGSYNDSEWEGFLEAARNTGEGSNKVKRDADWESAKNKYGGLLRNMLAENYFRCDTEKRFWLSFCLFLSTLGYIMLLAPSADLFFKVLVSTLGIII